MHRDSPYPIGNHMNTLAMSPHDNEIVRQGAEAWVRLKVAKVWTDWLCVGDALDVGRTDAMHRAGINEPHGKTYAGVFGRWLKQVGLDGVAKEERADLFAIRRSLPEIEAWRASLTLEQRLKLNHPRAVLRKWRASMKPKPEAETSEASAPVATAPNKAVAAEVEMSLGTLLAKAANLMLERTPDERMLCVVRLMMTARVDASAIRAVKKANGKRLRSARWKRAGKRWAAEKTAQVQGAV